MKYTSQQVWSYIEGWTNTGSNLNELDIPQISAMLRNALACLEDPNDGLAAYLERMEYYKRNYMFLSGTGGKSVFFEKIKQPFWEDLADQSKDSFKRDI